MTDDNWTYDDRSPDQVMREALEHIIRLTSKKAACNQRGRDDLIKAIAIKALWKAERRA